MNSLRIFIPVFLLAVTTMAAEGQDKKDPEPKRFNEALYPLQRNFRWTYRLTDLKAKTPNAKPQQVVITVDGEQIFRITKMKALETVQEPYVGFNLQVVGAGKNLSEQVLVTEEGVYRAGGAGKMIDPPLRILKANPRKGDTWKVDSQSENAQLKGSFVIDEETVQTPAGNYKAIVVHSQDFQVGSQKMQVDYWFSPNVGMVKQQVQVGNHHVMLELEKVEGGR